MDNKKKKMLLFAIILCATCVLVAIGWTYAYFTASVSSSEGAVTAKAAEFKLDYKDDLDLIKTNIIPSEEKYVNMATISRASENLNFPKPTTNPTTGQEEIAETTCIDDNLNEICSVYTFTVINLMDSDVPLYITLDQSINTFENLYIKVYNSSHEEVLPKTHIVDDRYMLDETGNYQKDSDGNLIKKENFDSLTITPIPITTSQNENKFLLSKTTDTSNPSTAKYTIVMWIMETFNEQNKSDGGKLFASTINVKTSGVSGSGITGVFSASGTE